MAIDLEMNQPSGKIIQIGICIGDPILGNRIYNKRYFINPREKLCSYICRLTGIEQQSVNNGISLNEAYS